VSELVIADLANHPFTPSHVAGHWRLVQTRLEGEASWLRNLTTQLQDGELAFAGEPDAPSRGTLVD
jgi:hypothetical protein